MVERAWSDWTGFCIFTTSTYLNYYLLDLYACSLRAVLPFQQQLMKQVIFSSTPPIKSLHHYHQKQIGLAEAAPCMCGESPWSQARPNGVEVEGT